MLDLVDSLYQMDIIERVGESRKAGMREVAEWVEANVFTSERTLSLEDYNEWRAFLREKGLEESK